jgi:hypothetical protein
MLYVGVRMCIYVYTYVCSVKGSNCRRYRVATPTVLNVCPVELRAQVDRANYRSAPFAEKANASHALCLFAASISGRRAFRSYSMYVQSKYTGSNFQKMFSYFVNTTRTWALYIKRREGL